MTSMAAGTTRRVSEGRWAGFVLGQDRLDGVEGRDQVAGTSPGGQYAVLVVVAGGDGQLEVFGVLLGGEFRDEGCLMAAGPGGVALRRDDADVSQGVDRCGEWVSAHRQCPGHQLTGVVAGDQRRVAAPGLGDAALLNPFFQLVCHE